MPFCKGLVGIEAIAGARLSRITGSGKGEGFSEGSLPGTARLQPRSRKCRQSTVASASFPLALLSQARLETRGPAQPHHKRPAP